MKTKFLLIILAIFGISNLVAEEKTLSPGERLTFSPTDMMKGKLIVQGTGEYVLTCESFNEFPVELWIFEKRPSGRLEPLGGNLVQGKLQNHVKVSLTSGKDYSFLANSQGQRPQINGVFSFQALQFTQVRDDLTNKLVVSKTPGALQELPPLTLSTGTTGYSLNWLDSGLWVIENGVKQPWLYRWDSPWKKEIQGPLEATNGSLGNINGKIVLSWTEKNEDQYTMQWRQLTSSHWTNILDTPQTSFRSRLALTTGPQGSSYSAFWESPSQGARLRVLTIKNEGVFTPSGKLWSDNDPSSDLWITGGAGDFLLRDFNGKPVVSLITSDESTGLWTYSGSGWENLQAMEVKQPQKIYLTTSGSSIYSGWLSKGKLIFQEWSAPGGWKALPELTAMPQSAALAWGGVLWVIQSDGQKIQIQRFNTKAWESVFTFNSQHGSLIKQVELIDSKSGDNSLWASYLEERGKTSILRLFQVY